MKYVAGITIAIVIALLVVIAGCKQNAPAPTGPTGTATTRTPATPVATGTMTPATTGAARTNPAANLPGRNAMKKVPRGQKTTTGTCAQCGKHTQVYAVTAADGKKITVDSPLCLRRYNMTHRPLYDIHGKPMAPK